MAAVKEQAAAAEHALQAAQADANAARAALAQQQAAAEQHNSKQLAQLQAQLVDLRQQLEGFVAAAEQKEATLAALRAEHDTLLAERQQLLEAVQAHQAGEEEAGKDGAAPAQSDLLRMLRDQREALQAQHEAAVEVGWDRWCVFVCNENNFRTAQADCPCQRD